MTTKMDKQTLPRHLKKQLKLGFSNIELKHILQSNKLHTICEEAKCPNIYECFNQGTATFLILGDICTRNCAFCSIKKGTPEQIDPSEPDRLISAIIASNIKHIVITSVTRDDLEDGGTSVFVECVKKIKENFNDKTIEILIPDFKGNNYSIKLLVDANPDIINHNLETVQRLYPQIRPEADYNRSIHLLKNIKKFDQSMITKSGIMIGLGETEDEVIELFKDLREVDCDIITIGQYLAPSKNHFPVKQYISKEQFKEYEKIAYELGFKYAASDVFVRSSYMAGEIYELIGSNTSK